MMEMAESPSLSVVTSPEPAPLATGGVWPSESSPRDDEDREDLSSGEEQSAAAALLGLHAAWPSSPDDESRDDDSQDHPAVGFDAATSLWGATSAAAGHQMYDSGEPYSPKNFRHHLDYDTPGYPSPKRMRAPKDGAPPPGTSRFRCKFPGCRKLYASTDAVRKHCRKRHLDWLRQIDRYSAHERGMPKPALYCVWGDEDGDSL